MNYYGDLQCCGIVELSDFAGDGNDDWQTEAREDDLAQIKRLSKRDHILAAVNTGQLKIKKMLEDNGFWVAATIKSRDNGRPVYLMARGFRFKNKPTKKSPRKKRGSR